MGGLKVKSYFKRFMPGEKVLKLCREILVLALEITEETKADAFVDYSGHEKELSVRIFLDGWTSGANSDIRHSIDLNKDDAVDKLRLVRHTLRYLKGRD